MGNSTKGFASMSKKLQHEIASKGGKAAHRKGTAHKWTSEEAKVAGEKGGKALFNKRGGAYMSEIAFRGGTNSRRLKKVG